MPILAENKHRYPPDWKQISRAVKERAGWRCACTGECGRTAEHASADPRCPNTHGKPALGFAWLVRLTTAHLDHTPENCADENLRAMCECCHLAYDREHHAATAARRKHERASTAEMFASDPDNDLMPEGHLERLVEFVRNAPRVEESDFEEPDPAF